MARIRPFEGLRYDVRKAGRADDLLAPPYDVVNGEGRRALASRSEANAIHFILPEGQGDEKYARGAAQFRHLVEQAMVHDHGPSLYVYHQQFQAEGHTYTRKGFVCLVELTRFGQGPVLAHERTLSGPKLDRLNLMRACEAHLELVFGLFSDPARDWEAAVAPAQGEPVLEASFDDVQHTLWRVHDRDAVAAVVDLLADKNIYIADGHHRYETMCTFRDELEARGNTRAGYGMIYLSNLDDPGLVVLPTHRLVHGLANAVDLPAVLERLTDVFEVQTASLPEQSAGVRKAVMAAATPEQPTIGLCVPGSGTLHLLRLRASYDPAAAGLGSLAPALQRLDVVLLHELVLERALGITKQAQADKTNLRYYKSTDAAYDVAAAPHNEVQLVCFMNATPVADVVAVCDSGEVMPQKSTFFFPKIPNGLVFHDLRSGDA